MLSVIATIRDPNKVNKLIEFAEQNNAQVINPYTDKMYVKCPNMIIAKKVCREIEKLR